MEAYQVDYVESTEYCSLSAVQQIASMLNLDPKAFAIHDALPRGWHFFLLAGHTRKSELRSDGFPGFGIPMPDLGLSRLLLSGRSVSYIQDIKIGSFIQRRSRVTKINQKSESLAFVEIQHELTEIPDTNAAIVETTNFILLNGKYNSPVPQKSILRDGLQSTLSKQVVPDDTMLFQYSALGFNSHKIHLDREYARNTEGYPDLVINGGLATLFMTEFLRNELNYKIENIIVKHKAPLFVNNNILIVADSSDNNWKLQAIDTNGVVAVDIEVKSK